MQNKRILKMFIKESLSLMSEVNLDKVIMKYDNSPDEAIPEKEIRSLGIQLVATADKYHVVYGQIVAQKDGDDIRYWSPERERWEIIDSAERQHPVSVHSPR